MGDVIHSLPAVASVKQGISRARVSWVIDPRWAPLVEDNPNVDETICFDRHDFASVRALWRRLRSERFDVAVDLQGLAKSAVIARASAAPVRVGFARAQARERVASWMYTRPVTAQSAHMVDRALELARAAGAGTTVREFPLPQGHLEGVLPEGRFVLASPLAGWGSKQWPLEYYAALAAGLAGDGCTLVVNGPPESRDTLARIDGARVHLSGLHGLIGATRRAAAVVGVDSGPMHLAAAIGRPGVAIFGPTDPARNGPYGGTFTVLRDPKAVTTYRRDPGISAAMRSVEPSVVLGALRIRMAFHHERTPG